MANLSVPKARSDRDVTAEVQHAIDVDRGIPGGVHAEAKNGEVTLTGHVHRPAQKQDAELAARAIAGVRIVTNRIEVKDHVEAPDDCC